MCLVGTRNVSGGYPQRVWRVHAAFYSLQRIWRVPGACLEWRIWCLSTVRLEGAAARLESALAFLEDTHGVFGVYPQLLCPHSVYGEYAQCV